MVSSHWFLYYLACVKYYSLARVSAIIFRET
nr:MAG TPA: hypothetical protein [Caudoviricetes sp.]